MNVTVRFKLAAVLSGVLSVFLAGCALLGIVSAPENPRARQFALDAVHDLENDNGPDLASRMAPQLRDQILGQIGQLRLYLPSERIVSERVVLSSSINITQSGQTVHHDRYTIELKGPRDWAYVRCEVLSASGRMVLNAFYVQRMYASYADFTSFSMKSLTYGKLFIVLTGILGLILSIVAWVVLYRSTAFSHKWAWAVAIAVSVTQTNLRWIDGAWGFNPLAFQILQPGVVRMDDGPWVITVSIPVFAIYVLVLHMRSLRPRPGVYE
jgi:hypothetical protein